MPNQSDLQEHIDREKGEQGPASPELCARLGINPDDLRDALPPTSPRSARASAPTRPRIEKEMLDRAAAALSKEAAQTKEAVITTVATYIANKHDNWWRQPREYQEKEIYFLIKMLVHTYNTLEER